MRHPYSSIVSVLALISSAALFSSCGSDKNSSGGGKALQSVKESCIASNEMQDEIRNRGLTPITPDQLGAAIQAQWNAKWTEVGSISQSNSVVIFKDPYGSQDGQERTFLSGNAYVANYNPAQPMEPTLNMVCGYSQLDDEAPSAEKFDTSIYLGSWFRLADMSIENGIVIEVKGSTTEESGFDTKVARDTTEIDQDTRNGLEYYKKPNGLSQLINESLQDLQKEGCTGRFQGYRSYDAKTLAIEFEMNCPTRQRDDATVGLIERNLSIIQAL